MPKRKSLLLAAAALACLAVLLRRRRLRRFLAGHWVADEDFLEQAGLQDMQMQLHSDLTRGYLLMHSSGGETLADAPLKLQLSGPALFGPAHMTFVPTEGTLPPGFPKKAKLCVNFSDMTLLLREGKKIKAFFYKDAAASARARELQ